MWNDGWPYAVPMETAVIGSHYYPGAYAALQYCFHPTCLKWDKNESGMGQEGKEGGDVRLCETQVRQRYG